MSHRIILAGLAAALLPSNAFAHAGHLGELAGHAHWIGAAAVAGAALVAGLVALKDRSKKQREAPPETENDEEDTVGEAQ